MWRIRCCNPFPSTIAGCCVICENVSDFADFRDFWCTTAGPPTTTRTLFPGVFKLIQAGESNAAVHFPVGPLVVEESPTTSLSLRIFNPRTTDPQVQLECHSSGRIVLLDALNVMASSILWSLRWSWRQLSWQHDLNWLWFHRPWNFDLDWFFRKMAELLGRVAENHWQHN